MKKKNKVAILLTIILACISFWFIVNNKNGTIDPSLRQFAVSDTASITKIVLSDKNNTLILERKLTNDWKINKAYPVQQTAISRLLYTINKIEAKEPVAKNIQNEIKNQLIQHAVKCEIYQNDKLIKTYAVGTATPDQSGTYMALIDLISMQLVERVFITCIPGIDGNLPINYTTDEKMWRNKIVFDYTANEIKSVKLETPFNPAFGYELQTKADGAYELNLANGEKFKDIDTAAIRQYLSYFTQLHFEKFETAFSKQQIDSLAASKPLNILTITTKSGQTNTVKFYARRPMVKGLKDINGRPVLFDEERMNAFIDNGKGLVTVQYYIFGKVMPPVDYFFRK